MGAFVRKLRPKETDLCIFMLGVMNAQSWRNMTALGIWGNCNKPGKFSKTCLDSSQHPFVFSEIRMLLFSGYMEGTSHLRVLWPVSGKRGGRRSEWPSAYKIQYAKVPYSVSWTPSTPVTHVQEFVHKSVYQIIHNEKKLCLFSPSVPCLLPT